MNIAKHLTTVGLMTVPESMQWHFSHKSRLGSIAAQVPGLQARFVVYSDSVTAFDNGFKFPASSPETKRLIELNTLRRRQATLIRQMVKGMMDYSCNARVRTAAGTVYDGFLKAYDDITVLSYEAETEAITSLIEESENPVYKVLIAHLNLTEHFDALKPVNIEFQGLYEQRYDTRYARKQLGRLTVLKSLADKAFEVVVQILSGLLLSETDPAKLALLNELATLINATIDQFTRVVHQRLGLSHGNHPKPGPTAPVGPTAPTDPENPGPTDPQTPDTTNPEAPFD